MFDRFGLYRAPSLSVCESERERAAVVAAAAAVADFLLPYTVDYRLFLHVVASCFFLLLLMLLLLLYRVPRYLNVKFRHF